MSNKPIGQLLKDLKSDTSHVPSDVFRKNAKIRILNRLIAAQVQKKPTSNKSMWVFLPFRMFALSFVMLCVVLLASQSSKPTNILFPVKVMSERVALTLSPNEKAKSAVVNTIISRRTSEVESAKKSGSTEAIEKAIQVLEKTTEELRQSQKNDSQKEGKEEDIDDDEDDNGDASDVKGSSIHVSQSPSPTSSIKTSSDNSKEEDSEDHKDDEDKRRSSTPKPSEKPEQKDSETHDDEDENDN